MAEERMLVFSLDVNTQRGEDLTSSLGIPKREKFSFKCGKISRLLSFRLLFNSFDNFWCTAYENSTGHHLK